jgi:hypothetical protein
MLGIGREWGRPSFSPPASNRAAAEKGGRSYSIVLLVGLLVAIFAVMLFG